MMRDVNDGVAECFFCGSVRRSDEGPRERETLMYNETIAGVRDLYDSGMPVEILRNFWEAQIRFDRTAEKRSCIHRHNSREKTGKCSEV
jgi:hypothetical protein